MDVEFKLVGNLTLKQFAYCLFGGGIAILAFTSPLNIFVKIPIMVFFGFLGFGLAFIPIDDRGLDIWLLNYIQAIYRPQRRIWARHPELPAYLTLDLSKPRPTSIIADHRLEKYLADENKDENDEKTEANLAQIQSLLQSESRATATTTPTVTEQLTVQAVSTRNQIPAMNTKVIERERNTLAGKINFNTGPVLKVAEKEGMTFFKPTITNINTNRPTVPEGHSQHPNPSATAPKVMRRMVPIENQNPQIPENPTEALERNRALLSQIKSVIADLTAYNSAGPRPVVDPALLSKQSQILLAQSGGGNLVKQLATQKQKSERVKSSPRVPLPPANMVPLAPQTAAINQISQQNEQILKELEHARKTLQSLKPPSIPHVADSSLPQATIPTLPPETFPTLEKKEPINVPPKSDHLTEMLLSQKELKVPSLSYSIGTGAPPVDSLSIKPNMITGKVADQTGNPISQAIVMIKDSDGIPQWAMRTDLGGEFKMSNPLANGNYAIDAQKPGYAFEEVKVTLSGGVLPGQQFTGTPINKS